MGEQTSTGKQTFITDVMFWNDWDSVNPFAKVNWRDFTFVCMSLEFAKCTKGKLRFRELHIAVLGLHLFINKFEDLSWKYPVEEDSREVEK